MSTTEIIKQLGLEETDARVYAALLELGPSAVSDIARRAGITRTLGYHVLEKLGVRGLVEKVSGHGKRQQFSAHHPRRLVQFVTQKRDVWEKRIQETERVLPDLVAVYKTAEKPTVRYQEGVEGVKSAYLETLESKEEILSVLDIDGWDIPSFRSWGKEYNRERSKRKIHERILMLDTPAGRAWMKSYQGSWSYTCLRWIAPSQVPLIASFGGETNIYENKVMICINHAKWMGITIESAALSNIMRSLFELAWQVASPDIQKTRTRTAK